MFRFELQVDQAIDYLGNQNNYTTLWIFVYVIELELGMFPPCSVGMILNFTILANKHAYLLVKSTIAY